MKTVTIAWAIDGNGKTIIGIAESVDNAIGLIKTTGYGYDLTNDQLALLAILGYTNNLTVNFKIETWEVH